MTSLTQSNPKIYANPSWTMAIASQPSSLSRWWGQSLSKVTGFTLQLKASEENSDLGFDQAVIIQGSQAQLEGFAQLTEQYVQSRLGRSLNARIDEDTVEIPAVFAEDAPDWQAESFYSHRLHFGSLQVEPILRDLKVSTSQLYDLAEILNQSVIEVPALPSGVVRALPGKQSPAWGKTAAVAAIALSLTGGAAWLMGGGSVFQTATESESEELVSLESPQADDTPENAPLTLPPNFQVNPTKPLPTKQQGKTTAQKTKPSLSNDTPIKNKVDLGQIAAAQQKLPQSGTNNDVVTTNGSPNNQVEESISQDTRDSTQVSKTANATTQPKKIQQKRLGERNSELGPTSVQPEVSSESVGAIADASSPSSEQQAVAAAPPVVTKPVVPQAPAKAANAPLVPPPDRPQASDFSIASGVMSRRAAGPSAASKTTVLRFFQSQWEGQDSLDQNLLYTIVVKPDGSVQSVTPKNDVASTKFSQAPLPNLGDPFIPPFSGASSASFEVTLFPDGTVSVK